MLWHPIPRSDFGDRIEPYRQDLLQRAKKKQQKEKKKETGSEMGRGNLIARHSYPVEVFVEMNLVKFLNVLPFTRERLPPSIVGARFIIVFCNNQC